MTSAVQERLHAVLTEKFEVPADLIAPDATLDGLGLDSLSLAELALVLQEELGVQVAEHEAAKWTTVAELAGTLQAGQATRRPA